MLTEKLQAMLNDKIAGSPRARELLRELEGHSLDIHARHTPWRVQLTAAPNRLLLNRHPATPGIATISGTPLSLLALTRENPQQVIRRGDVTIGGDGAIAARFQELLELLRPDLEEPLSRLIGDVPAYGLGSLLRRVGGYVSATSQTAARNVGEYFTHERRELVTRAEAREFLDGVDQLREQVDRLNARIALMETKA
ncbi:MAG: SCP2 sterol-binding domain-containing protein [Nevskiaceae bacterium]|jgi:ubiquinone biosynthesis protein UbiJ|nr:SCP2 sterol-binding domain-containing protein [Nevskiaceae bacterium]